MFMNAIIHQCIDDLNRAVESNNNIDFNTVLQVGRLVFLRLGADEGPLFEEAEIHFASINPSTLDAVDNTDLSIEVGSDVECSYHVTYKDEIITLKLNKDVTPENPCKINVRSYDTSLKESTLVEAFSHVETIDISYDRGRFSLTINDTEVLQSNDVGSDFNVTIENVTYE